MLRRIHLHGSLAELHKGPIEVVAATVAEAIKCVTLQVKGFAPNARRGRLRVRVVGCDTLDSLMTEGPQDIHLIPQLNGGKNGGFFQVLIGAVLVAASFAATALGLPTIGGILLKVGITLMIGGVLQLLQQPPRENDSNSKKNHYLGSPQNTTQIGTTIPILCGRRKVGGQFLSFQIAPVEVA